MINQCAKIKQGRRNPLLFSEYYAHASKGVFENYAKFLTWINEDSASEMAAGIVHSRANNGLSEKMGNFQHVILELEL